MDDPRVAIAAIQERIGALQQSVSAEHARIDKIDQEVKAQLILISQDIKILLAHMNKAEGSRSQTITIATLAIALLGALGKILFFK